MPCPTLSLIPSSYTLSSLDSKYSKFKLNPTRTKFLNLRTQVSSSWINDFDLYELLGVESSSDYSEIKKAYRNLQKRCHPDIAGEAGHDMAIILNQVYSLLSDPESRSAYDQEQSKLSEFRGYTGKPLYSTWYGSENEQRAIFVDEVKCVGCLKCALHANRTFAIESVYGRARAIAQWADPEDKIFDAIETCPVDCISIIERSNLAALEFLMSKQPRGNVRMTGGGNTGGARVSNIFAEIKKFQTRFGDIHEKKASREQSKEFKHERESRISALQSIKSISNWLYWRAPSQTQSESSATLNLIHIPQKFSAPDTKKLEEAAAKLKSLENSESAKKSSTMSSDHNEEYWKPVLTLPTTTQSSRSVKPKQEAQPSVLFEKSTGEIRSDRAEKREWNVMTLSVPLVMAVVSGAVVGNRGASVTGHGLDAHIGGSRALEVVNSFEMQVVLAGITWFVIGLGIIGMFEVIGSNRKS